MSPFFSLLARGSVWNTAIISTFLFIIATPVIWWHYFGLRHLFHNRPVTEILGLALWFGYGVVTMPIAGDSQDPYTSVQNVTFVLLLIVTAVGAILTTRLNQRLGTPQPWPTTLAMGSPASSCSSTALVEACGEDGAHCGDDE